MDSKTFGYVALGGAVLFGFIGISLWSIGLGGLFFFISGCCALFWYYSTTSEGQRFLKESARLSKERQEEARRIEEERNKITPQYIAELFSELATSPSDHNLCDEIVRSLQISDPFIFPGNRTKEVYERALEVLEANSEITYLKQFCLSVGRWHCGRNRINGAVTIYDEQAIHNDINVRVN